MGLDLAPGIHDIRESDYHADAEWITSGDLKAVIRSPAHYKANREAEKKPPTPAMVQGSVIHCLALEPGEFNAKFVREPKGINKRTNAGKTEYAAFLDEHAGLQVVTDDQYQVASEVAMAIRIHPTASKLIKPEDGVAEISKLWEDPSTGLKCKARADFYNKELGIVVDLKSAIDARPEAFARSIFNFGYDIQVAHYTRGFDVAMFVFIAVEKEPPYGIHLYTLEQAAIDRAYEIRGHALNTLQACIANNTFPGYDEEISIVELPAWMKRRDDNA